MFFRRPRPKVRTFNDHLDELKKTGFAIENLSSSQVRISKNGIAAIVTDVKKDHPEIQRAGLLVGSEIATLLSGGYQMFWETPGGKRFPATATQLKSLHEFEDDVKEALAMVNLYNTSLGTTTPKHMYDRVFKRDTGQQPTPWKNKDNRIVPPDTKGSMHL